MSCGKKRNSQSPSLVVTAPRPWFQDAKKQMQTKKEHGSAALKHIRTGGCCSDREEDVDDEVEGRTRKKLVVAESERAE